MSIMSKEQFLNTYISNCTRAEVISQIEEMIPNKASQYVIALNVDVLVKIEYDAKLKEVSDKADISIADGKPLIWISKLYGNPIKEKISGSDLVPELCSVAAEKGYSVFILGGMGDTAEVAAKNMQKANPGLKVAGTYSPPFGFEKSREECDKINSILAETKPDILFVCFGCPKQEKWIFDHRDEFSVGVCVCAGATVDFLAGRIKRAPKWMSEHGLEWFYRFLKEPGRLFRRYFVDDMQIIKIALKYSKQKQ